MELMKLEDVSFSYDGKTEVLEKINISLHEGDYMLLLGPNGGGKTTLLKVMMGLEKPNCGKISCSGNFGGRTGYVPQKGKFRSDFPISVRETVLGGLLSDKGLFGRRFSSFEREKADQLITEMGLQGCEDTLIGELSGGQLQKTLIARAMINSPKILFLDEPVSNLDPDSQKNLYDLLEKLSKQVCIVMASHDLAVAPSYATTIVCVNKKAYQHRDEENSSLPKEELEKIMNNCPLEYLAHGTPHRVLAKHEQEERDNA